MKPRPRAFTLVELLVVVGIIALLIGILLPALNTARRQARLLRTSSDLRQLLIAYTAYHTENRGLVPWGYPPKKVNGTYVIGTDPVTGYTFSAATSPFGGLIATRFPWRLLPYFSNVWPLLHNHIELPPLTARGDSQAVAEGKAYNLSVNPAFGINAVYVGGTYAIQYPSFTPAGGNDGTPVTGKHCVFRSNEVKNPTRLIVFAESQNPIPGGADPTQGLPYLMPPFANGQRWKVEAGEKIISISPAVAGLPQGRYGKRTVTGFFDGHVDTVLPSELFDMRLWAAKATTADYDFVP